MPIAAVGGQYLGQAGIETCCALCRDCGDSLVNLAKLVWTAVKKIFAAMNTALRRIIEYFHARQVRRENVQAVRHLYFNMQQIAERYHQQHRNHVPRNIDEIVIANQELNIPPPVLAPDVPRGPDHARVLDAFRQSLQTPWGYRDYIDMETFSHLTPRDFIQLYAEFPQESESLIECSIEWAKRRPIQIDPNHPFFEIFQSLLQNRNDLEGQGYSDNYQTYLLAPDREGYWEGGDKFRYTVYTIMGFQELNRADCRNWLQLIDNGEASSDANPAYRFARTLSKIFIYPSRTAGMNRMDIYDKVHHAMNILWNAYYWAKAMGEEEKFFKEAFHKENCFDARVSTMQNFMEMYIAHPEFNVNIGSRASIEHRVLEHFRVFRNTQIRTACQQQHLLYKDFKHLVDMYGGEQIPPEASDRNGHPIDEEQRTQINAHLLSFNARFNAQGFEAYLQENHQPLRALIEVWDPREWRNILKPQGPALQRGDFQDAHGRIEGWESILRRQGMWPGSWG